MNDPAAEETESDDWETVEWHFAAFFEYCKIGVGLNNESGKETSLNQDSIAYTYSVTSFNGEMG